MSVKDISGEDIAFLDSLQQGDLVEHPKWGIGSIIQRSGSGDRTKLVVAFPEAEGTGQKKLMAKFSKLRKIEDAKPATEDLPKAAPEEKEVKAPAKPAKGREPIPAAAGAIRAEEEEEDDDEDDDTLLPEINEDDDDEDLPAKGTVEESDWESQEN